MALGDGSAKKETQDVKQELNFILDAVSSIGDQLVSSFESAIDGASDLNSKVDVVGKTMQRGLVADLKKAVSNTNSLIDLQSKITRGVATQKDISKEAEKVALNRARLDAKRKILGDRLTKRQKTLLAQEDQQLGLQEKAVAAMQEENDLLQKNKSLLQIAKENAGGLLDKMDKTGTASKILKGGLGSVLTTSRLLELAVLGVFKAMVSIDKLNGELAKGLNMSYSNAAALSSELSTAANMSGAVKLTAEGLGKALLAVNDITGVYTTENSKNLQTFQELHKASGLTYEQMGGIYSVTQATGGDLKKNTKEVLAQSTLTAQSYGVQINSKKVLADIGKISKATTLSLGGSAAELSKALTTSQALGIEMGQMESIADGLLNFEQSIANEMEAEMLTGKSLNLEKARQLALDNDIAGAAAEIAKQVGTAAEFGAMNRIQQEALAKATGLSREELANSLFVQEQLANSVGSEYDDKKKIIDELQKKGLSQDQIKAKLGKESLADLKAQSSVQENLNKSVSKMKEVFVSIAAPLMQIITPIVDVLLPAVGALGYAFELISVPIKIIGDGIKMFVDGLKEASAISYAILGFTASILLLRKQSTGQSLIQMGIEKAKQGYLAAEKATLFVINGIKNKSLLKDIGLMAMRAFSSLSAIPVIGPALGIAAAAAAAALGYQYYNKADDMMSPGGSGGGYGSRTLMGPEGAIALNNKDTVIAGTNLFPKEGKQPQQVASAQISMARLEDLQASTNALLDNILNKQGTVTMDSTEVGTSFAINSYQVQ